MVQLPGIKDDLDLLSRNTQMADSAIVVCGVDGLTTDHKGFLEWLRVFKHITAFLFFGGKEAYSHGCTLLSCSPNSISFQLAKAPGR